MTAADIIIERSLKNSFSYTAYREHMLALLVQGLSTGATQSEALTHYSTLNEVRMNRLDKTVTVPNDIAKQLEAIATPYTLLILTESWCGDAAQIVPVINKMALLNPKLDVRIVLRDDNPDLMDAYLTNGTRSIPKLIVVEKETGVVKGSWGPRPAVAAAMVREDKEKHGKVTDEAKTELQRWYLQDKGLSTMKEVADLLG